MSSYFSTKIVPAAVYFDGHVPVSKTFDDIYFSKQHSSEESTYVFLEGNHLQARFSEATEGCFCIGEMGFGTGLNFLNTWKLWEEIIPPHCTNKKMLFVSAEKHPLPKAHILQALQHLPELQTRLHRLMSLYPPFVGGYHLIACTPQVSLLLMLGDATQMWQEFSGKIDAWFLDGFAPSKNEEMWSEDLCKEIASHSKPHQTTLSTFSVASIVKKGLDAQGFFLKKQAGFGHKREMLTGKFTPPFPPCVSVSSIQKPKTVGIVGAGLAGLWMAKKLKERNIQCLIFEKEMPATKASGNAVGLLSPYMNKVNNPHAAFLMMSFLYTKSFLAQHPTLAEFGDMVHFAKNEVQRNRMLHIAHSNHYPDSFLRLRSEDPTNTSFMLGEGGCAFPKKICEYLINNDQLNVHTQQEVYAIEKTEQGWKVSIHRHKPVWVDQLILCQGEGILNFMGMEFPFLGVLDGVVFDLPKSALHTPLPHSVRFGKYICNAPSATHLHLGGVSKGITHAPPHTYALWMNEVRQLLPTFFPSEMPMDGYRLCQRLNSSDRLPVVGAVCSPRNGEQLFGEDVLLNVGHGSRGIITTPLVAELLARSICGEPSPIPKSVGEAIASERFWKRTHKSTLQNKKRKNTE